MEGKKRSDKEEHDCWNLSNLLVRRYSLDLELADTHRSGHRLRTGMSITCRLWLIAIGRNVFWRSRSAVTAVNNVIGMMCHKFDETITLLCSGTYYSNGHLQVS